ncbi:MAG: dockerin type I repeat-containing protein [Bacteroidales bacterium]|nr:dockerin type I repeat-containing protein [Bacteroidales bacterium]
MKKTITFLAALVASIATTAFAQDLVIPTNETSGVEILQDGVFDRVNRNIGNTSANTQVYLGEVDFGEDGNLFQATSIVLGNGWYVDGWAILHAGTSYEESMPFTQMGINETGGYQNYRTFGSNMSYNAASPEELSGGQPAMEGITFVKPKGKMKVWLTFVGGAGNIRYINFYKKAFTPEDFVNDEGDWDSGIRLLDPNEKPGYDAITMRVLSLNSVPAVPIGEGTDFPDTRIDTSANGQNAWGWTHEGFIADYGVFDFGGGEYSQLVAYFTHWSTNIYDYLEFYLDEVKPENMFARVWSGLDLGNGTPRPFAKDLKTPITGQHRVLVKWVGGSSNLQIVEFCKGKQWPEHPDCGIELVDELPNEGAFHFTFNNCPEGQGNPWGYEVKCKGRWEAAGNIGYTGNGTVLDFFDNGDGMADGIDFGDGKYNRIVINHSSEPAWIGTIEESNFSFYVDLDPDMIYTPEQWDTELEMILEGHEPVAVVRLQGTGAWSVKRHTAGPLAELTGKHELFMVYNTPNSNTGANVFDIYLDVEKQGTPGDINGDGIVNVSDVTALISKILGEAEYSDEVCDVNGDGVINVSDVTALIGMILGE